MEAGVSGFSGGNIEVKKSGCKRGVRFAAKELTNPERILTSTVKVRGGELPLVSVKSGFPVPKYEMQKLIREMDALVIDAPVKAGAVLRSGVGANQVEIITTRTIDAL